MTNFIYFPPHNTDITRQWSGEAAELVGWMKWLDCIYYSTFNVSVIGLKLCSFHLDEGETVILYSPGFLR